MTESKAIELLEYIREIGNGEVPYVGCAQNIAIKMAINALEERIAKKPDEYVPELLDDEIKLPYKISRFEAKAIKLALHHEWIRDTGDNGKAISCSQEMADATYRMLSLFDKLIIESDKDEQSKEQNK